MPSPRPVGRGWKNEKEGADEQLVLHWMDGQPAPQATMYWPATVQRSVNYSSVNVWQIGSNALICAGCLTVRTRPSLPVKKVWMGMIMMKNWKMITNISTHKSSMIGC